MSPIQQIQRTVWYAPTARRHYLTKRGACFAEARARIRKKYSSEAAEYDDYGRLVYPGWCWRDLLRAEVLLKRYARVLFKSIK